MFEHLVLQTKQLVLKSDGHMKTGTDLQQDNAVSVFIHMLVLHFHMQILKHLTVSSVITVIWFEVQKQRFLNVTQCIQHHFTGICLRLEFLWLGQSGVPPLQVCLFSCVFEMVTHLTACENMWQQCIIISMEPVAMFQLYWHTMLLVCLLAGVGYTVSSPCDSTIPYDCMCDAETHIHSTDKGWIV